MKKTPVKVVFADTHLSEDNLTLNYSIWTQAIDLAAQLKVELVHLGDVFHNRKRSGQSLSVLYMFYTILNYAHKKGVIIKAIPGNHDKIDQESKNSYLDVFSTHPSLVVYDEPHRQHDKYNIEYCFVPYFKEDGRYPQELKKVVEKNDKLRVLFTHIGISGVKNNDGSIVSNDITEKTLNTFDKVFVGHYHNRSSINEHIYYIGSAMPHNFKEDNEKGFTILYHDLTFDYHEAVFPKFITHEFTIGDTETYQDILKASANNDGDRIRVVIRGDIEDLVGFDKTDLENLGVKIVQKSSESVANVENADQEKIVHYDSSNILEAFESYCQGVTISKKLKAKGTEMLKKII